MEDKEKIKERMNELVNKAVDRVDTDESLKHFEIEIKVHQEKYDMKTITKNRGNLY